LEDASSSVPNSATTQAANNDGTVPTTANTTALANVAGANSGLVTSEMANLNLASIDDAASEISDISATEAAELSAKNAAAKHTTDTAALLATTTSAEKSQLLATIASLTGQVTSLSSFNTQLIRHNRVPTSANPAVSSSMLNNTPSTANANATIFQKQQTKQIKPLSITPSISECVAFLRNLAELETTGRGAFTTSIQAVVAYAA
jgi:hypothetical protein